MNAEFSQASESFKAANPHIFAPGTLGQVLLEPEEKPSPSKEEIKSERILQGQIVNILRLRSIEVCWHRTDTRSAATVGWPDLTFAVNGQAIAWEVKLPGGKLSKDQERVAGLLIHPPNNWQFRIIHSVDEALSALKVLGFFI